MIESKGWLKPIKLKEITGTPAADVIAQEFREEIMLKKKQEFIKKYHTRLAQANGPKGFKITEVRAKRKQEIGSGV